MDKKKVAFICVHNSCRSQIAEDVDIAISMGCNVGCPFIGRPFDDNWELEDPTGKSDKEFVKIIKQIETKILDLKDNLKN